MKSQDLVCILIYTGTALIILLMMLINQNNRTSLTPYFFSSLTLHPDLGNSSSWTCPTRGERWIVITSIVYPTRALVKFIRLKTPWNIVVVANRKTPPDWRTRLSANISKLLFLSLSDQKNLNFRVVKFLPEESYARKNIGYLVAIACGARIIFESDDDPLFDTRDILVLPKTAYPTDIPWIAFRRQRSPFVNIYASFGQPNIWPRGFPPDELRNVSEDGWHSVRRNDNPITNAYIQQYLTDLDPDVDAIYRLAHPLTIGRIKFDLAQPPIALDSFTFSPYNAQNTITHYEAFWGLFLPVTTTFRVCDIWRGLWVQRLLWDIGGRLVFGTSTRKQVHNNRSYVVDMDDEHQLYHQSGSFARFLTRWSSNEFSLVRRIAQLARDIAQAHFWNAKEIDIIDAWLADLRSINYSFPSLVHHPSGVANITRKKTAVCVTGLAECVVEVWSKVQAKIEESLQSNVDVFFFLSSSYSKGFFSAYDRLKAVRSYRNASVTVLYEDRIIDPKINGSCYILREPTISDVRFQQYYQQLWSFSECFDLVKHHEKSLGIQYELFIRARPDHHLERIPSNLTLHNGSSILIPDEHHFGGYNDRFAIGPIDAMKKYMRRWHELQYCYERNIHAESYLKAILKRFNISVELTTKLSMKEEPHGEHRCH